MGIRIQCQSADQHIKIIEDLKSKDFNFFTYDLPEKRMLKFVLSGPKFDVEEIKTELQNSGLTTVQEVKQMTIKTTRFDDHYIYLVKFSRNSINLKALQQVKALFNIIIKWDNYRRNKSGPVLCTRCQNFGHAEANCHLKTRCGNCGEDHLTKNCVAFKNPEFKNKCCNCGEQHKPVDPKCKKRLEFIELRQKIQERHNRKIPSSSYNVPRNRTTNNTIQSSSDQNKQIRGPFNSTMPVRPEISYADIVTNPEINMQYNNSPFNLNLSNNINNNNSLFTFQEITDLVNDIIVQLSQCKTKTDQFRVITNISIKYLYGSK